MKETATATAYFKLLDLSLIIWKTKYPILSEVKTHFSNLNHAYVTMTAYKRTLKNWINNTVSNLLAPFIYMIQSHIVSQNSQAF